MGRLLSAVLVAFATTCLMCVATYSYLGRGNHSRAKRVFGARIQAAAAATAATAPRQKPTAARAPASQPAAQPPPPTAVAAPVPARTHGSVLQCLRVSHRDAFTGAIASRCNGEEPGAWVRLPKPKSNLSEFDENSIGVDTGKYAAAMSARTSSEGCKKLYMSPKDCHAICLRAEDPVQCLANGTYGNFFGDPNARDVRHAHDSSRWMFSKPAASAAKPRCKFHRFTETEALCALRGMHIALLGDSLMRNIFRDLQMYLAGSASEHPGQWKSNGDCPTSTNPATGITLSFWWTPCVIGVDVKSVVKKEKRSVCAKTEWDPNGDHDAMAKSTARHASAFPKKLTDLFGAKAATPQPRLVLVNFGVWQTENAVNGTAALEYWIRRVQENKNWRVAFMLPWRVRYSFNPTMHENSDDDIPERYKPPVMRDIARRLRELCARLPRCFVVDPWLFGLDRREDLALDGRHLNNKTPLTGMIVQLLLNGLLELEQTRR